jgi:hypothetical protein
MQIDVKVEAEFLASLLQERDVIESDLLHSIEPEYFQVDSYQWLVRLLITREWKPIVFNYLDQELLSIEEDETRTKYRNQLYALYAMQLTFEEDAAKKFRAYVSFCVLNSKTREGFEGFSRTDRVDFLIDAVQDGVDEASRIIRDHTLPVVDYASDYSERQERRRHLRDNPSVNPRLLTGIMGLDQQFVIKAPMLVDFMAPFKRYKSIFLNALGYSFLLQGHDVLHVTYENSLELTMDRYDAMFSEINYERVANLLITEEEKLALDRTFEWVHQWRNRLKIIKCTPQETTVKDVEEEMERLRDTEGFEPSVSVWDYLNIIKPSKEFRQERHEQKQIVWDLKIHAEKYNTAVIEASQANMEGAKADRLTLGHRGLSTDISRGIDLCIGIDQDDKERDEGIIVLSPMFFRGGAITIPEVILDSDLPRMVISRELHRLWQQAAKVNPYISSS